MPGECQAVSANFRAGVPADYEDGAPEIMAEILSTNVCTRKITSATRGAVEGQASNYGTDIEGSFSFEGSAGYSESGCGALTPIITAFKNTKEQISCIVNRAVQEDTTSAILTNSIHIVSEFSPAVAAAIACGRLPGVQGKFIQEITGRIVNNATFSSTVKDSIQQQLDTLVDTVIKNSAENKPGWMATTGNAVSAVAGEDIIKSVQNDTVTNQLVQSVITEMFQENKVTLVFYNWVGPLPDINQSLIVDIMATKMVGATLKTAVDKWTSVAGKFDYTGSSDNSAVGLDGLLTSFLDLALVTSTGFLIGIGAIVGVVIGGLLGLSTKFTTWGLLLAVGLICIAIGIVATTANTMVTGIACTGVGLVLVCLAIYIKLKPIVHMNNNPTISGSQTM